ncbi:MAG: putative cardiolipin synthase [Thermoproteota archaeon]|jgi:putative cardiolipin synthase
MRFSIWIFLLFISIPCTFAQEAFIFDDTLSASQIRIDKIRNESSFIHGNFYLLKEQTALIHAALLRDAARRGVEVKIILDRTGTGLDKAFVSYLMHQGIEVKVYNNYSLTNFSVNKINKRMHDKMIVTSSELIIGDRNSGDEYFNLGGVYDFKAREILVKDPTSHAKAMEYFKSLWRSKKVKRIKRLGQRDPAVLAIGRKVDETLQKLKSGTIARTKFIGTHWDSEVKWDEKLKPAHSLNFVHDIINNSGPVTGSYIPIIKLIDSAKSYLVLENPYVVLTKRFFAAINRALSRGVRVIILTNSYETNDVELAAKAFDADFPRLASMGVEIYEYAGNQTLHVKNILVDNNKGYVGSYNLDNRSERLNSEVGVIFESLELAASLNNQINKDIKKSKLVAKDGQAFITKKKRWFFNNIILPIIRRLL